MLSCRQLLHKGIVELGEKFKKKLIIMIINAILNLHSAWETVDQKAIAKCWKNILSSDFAEEDKEDNIPLSILSQWTNKRTSRL